VNASTKATIVIPPGRFPRRQVENVQVREATVGAMETPVAKVEAQGYAVSARRFRQFALAAAVMLLVVVATGATVRLTASGLGCEHWPGCQPGQPFPENGIHSYVEFGNRIVAFVTIVATLLAGGASVFVAGLPRWTKALAWSMFAGTFAQAPLGAITVYYKLNPWLVLSHFLLSLAVLTAGVVVALEAIGLERGRARPLVPPWLRAAAVVFGAACVTMVITGTMATASGPHPGSREGVRRLGNFQTAIEVHVRATAVFGILLLVLLTALWRRRTQLRGLLVATLALLCLLVAQMTIGEIQYRNRLPWWLVLVHVTMAATVWAATVALVTSFFRPLGPGK
jgi:cytochrome c oxidase assembly protein subunit 15